MSASNYRDQRKIDPTAGPLLADGSNGLTQDWYCPIWKKCVSIAGVV